MEESRSVRVSKICAFLAFLCAVTLWHGLAIPNRLTIWLSGACGGLALFFGLAEALGRLIGRKMMLHSVPHDEGI